MGLMKKLAEYSQALLGIRLTARQISAFQHYEQELIDWNTRYNLTAIDDPEKIQLKHFLDSLTCLLAMRSTPFERVIDVGTGAGFPGIPLKIVCPSIRLTLVDSVKKKVNFCQHIVELLELEMVQVIWERVETLARLPAHREQYDWAIARAVASLPVLAEYMLPFVRVGGKMLAMKGENAPQEVHSAERSFHLLGGRVNLLQPVSLPEVPEERYLVTIDKVAATPPAYPRRAGLPAKHPL